MRNDLFIHFFNRELYRSLGIKDFPPAHLMLKIAVFACSEVLHIPLSSLWENWNRQSANDSFLKLLYESGHLEIASDCVTIEEFIERNRRLYHFDKERYYHIYFRSTKTIDWLKPTERKGSSATRTISDTIQTWGNNPEAELILPKNEAVILQASKMKIVEINRNREDKALTASLFSSHFKAKSQLLPIARFLSAYYIKDYCQCFHADILTGLRGSLGFYDYLAQEYPYHDMRVLQYILALAGVTPQMVDNIKCNMWEEILTRRTSGDTVYLIQQMIIYAVDNCKLLFDGRDIGARDVCSYIANSIHNKPTKKIKAIKSTSDLEFYSENIQIIASQILNKNCDTIYLPTIMQTEMRCTRMEQKLFISHSSEDREYVQLIVNLLESIGVTQIFCSSVPGYGVPLSEDIYDYLKREFSNFNLYVLFVLSDHYYNSVASLNEMGAAWVLQKEYMCILLPGFKFRSIEGAVNPRKVGIKLDTDSLDVLNYLNQWKEQLESMFHLIPIQQARWERIRSDFLAEVGKLASK